MTSKRIGYIRVSTLEQNPDRQLEGIELDRKFIDYASAISTNRPQLNQMIEYVRENDTIIVHSMDRLARNVHDLRKLVTLFVSRGINVQFMKEQLTFTDKKSCPMSNLMLSLLGAFGEFEYDFIKERQREGIEVAKKRGVFKGRTKAITKEKALIIDESMKTRKSKVEICQDIGISRVTLYKYLKEKKVT